VSLLRPGLPVGWAGGAAHPQLYVELAATVVLVFMYFMITEYTASSYLFISL